MKQITSLQTLRTVHKTAGISAKAINKGDILFSMKQCHGKISTSIYLRKCFK